MTRRRSPSSGWYPPPSVPRPVEGGIKTRSARGAIGDTWWSQRFIAVLEEIGVGSRLQRGKRYARQGQVISLDVDAGMVTAVVQGSRARPYRVRISLVAFGKRDWARLEAALSGDAWYAAKLLAGEMPDDIEDIFAGHGLPLFPQDVSELTMDCTCPDWEVPCKHIAASVYLLAEAFDDDPFTILAWRGRDRDELLANLAAARSVGTPAADRVEHRGTPLAELLQNYFSLQAQLPLTAPPTGPATALLDQLPDTELDVRGHPLAELLRPAYESLAARAERDSA